MQFHFIKPNMIVVFLYLKLTVKFKIFNREVES
jgi:hypothetical protein